MEEIGKLYIVGTPIGNMEDMTFRAVRILKSVDFIACEDKRHSQTLLNKYEIAKPLLSYHKFNEKACCAEFLKLINEGKTIALISDAGMPAISDPGAILVKFLRENNCKIEVVPGPTALTSAVALCGLTQNGFTFAGFLPEKNKQRQELLSALKTNIFPTVFYSPPHNINKDIADAFKAMGERDVVVCKELTKIYENLTATKLSTFQLENPKGEFVFIVMPSEACEDVFEGISIKQHILNLMKEGLDKKEAIQKVSEDRKISKKLVYIESFDI